MTDTPNAPSHNNSESVVVVLPQRWQTCVQMLATDAFLMDFPEHRAVLCKLPTLKSRSVSGAFTILISVRGRFEVDIPDTWFAWGKAMLIGDKKAELEFDLRKRGMPMPFTIEVWECLSPGARNRIWRLMAREPRLSRIAGLSGHIDDELQVRDLSNSVAELTPKQRLQATLVRIIKTAAQKKAMSEAEFLAETQRREQEALAAANFAAALEQLRSKKKPVVGDDEASSSDSKSPSKSSKQIFGPHFSEEVSSSANLVQVFNSDFGRQLAGVAKINNDKESVVKTLLADASQFGGWRLFPAFDESTEKRLEDLRARFPHFSDVIDRVLEQLLVNAVRPFAARRFFPLLIVGHHGIGKTEFARELAAVLGLHFHDENCGSITAGFVLKGAHAMWGSAEPGLVARVLSQSPTSCPLILLDEMDKLGGGDHRYPVMPVLLSLLEPSSSAHLRDEFCRGTFDASRIFYIATANQLGGVPLPLLSRFHVIEVKKPDARQRFSVLKNIVAREHPNILVNDDVLEDVAKSNLDFRDFKNRLGRVVAAAVKRHRTQFGLEGVAKGTVKIEVTRFDLQSAGVKFPRDL